MAVVASHKMTVAPITRVQQAPVAQQAPAQGAMSLPDGSSVPHEVAGAYLQGTLLGAAVYMSRPSSFWDSMAPDMARLGFQNICDVFSNSVLLYGVAAWPSGQVAPEAPAFDTADPAQRAAYVKACRDVGGRYFPGTKEPAAPEPAAQAPPAVDNSAAFARMVKEHAGQYGMTSPLHDPVAAKSWDALKAQYLRDNPGASQDAATSAVNLALDDAWSRKSVSVPSTAQPQTTTPSSATPPPPTTTEQTAAAPTSTLPAVNLLAYFQAPSGNVICGDWAFPPKYDQGRLECTLLSAEATWRLTPDGASAGPPGLDVRNTADLAIEVLSYGRTWRFDGYTCVSRPSGLTCRNNRKQGFFLSRETQRTF